jgi:hypothetical protein
MVGRQCLPDTAIQADLRSERIIELTAGQSREQTLLRSGRHHLANRSHLETDVVEQGAKGSWRVYTQIGPVEDTAVGKLKPPRR